MRAGCRCTPAHRRAVEEARPYRTVLIAPRDLRNVRDRTGVLVRHQVERAGLARIVAIAREENIASRTLLGGLGMTEAEPFTQNGYGMILFQHKT